MSKIQLNDVIKSLSVLGLLTSWLNIKVYAELSVVYFRFKLLRISTSCLAKRNRPQIGLKCFR